MQINDRLRDRQYVHLRRAWLRIVFPVLVGGSEFILGIAIDVSLGIHYRPIFYSDVFTGIIAAVLALLVVRYYERLRQSDSDRLRVAADVNHHVRNALTTVLYSVHVKRDPELIKVTQEAVDRIDWILREILWETDEQPSISGSGQERT
jgi:hypothetical protein